MLFLCIDNNDKGVVVDNYDDNGSYDDDGVDGDDDYGVEGDC